MEDKVMVTVFNKTDRGSHGQLPRDLHADHQVRISARTGEGLDTLVSLLESILRNRNVYLEQVFPYQEAGRIQQIRKYGELLSEEYREDGIAVKAYVPAELFAGLKEGRG